YKTTPPTEWHGRGLDDGLMEAFDWLQNKTLKDSVVSIQWSHGHLLTGAAERATVCDGAEVAKEEGKWENDPSVVPRPPDYIYYDTQRDSMRIRNYYGMYNALGEYISAKSYAVNGRRIDVQRFPIVGENEFRWYLTAYRNNYGVKIDYVVFSYDEYYNAWSYYNSTQPMSILLGAQRLRTPSQLQPSVEGQNYVFNFGENREAVVLDAQNRNVYLRVGAESLGLDGYGVFTVNKQGKISDYLGFSPPPSTPAIKETMLVFLDERGSIVSAWLVKGVSAEVTGRPVPMALRVFTGDIGGIEYLQVPLTSSNGLVKVIKINHVPALIFPANGARTNDSTPELIWSGAIGAAKYKLEVDDNADFSSPVVQVDNLITKSYTTPVLADDNYSWRVGAYDNKGDFLGWSDVFTFVIDTQPPSQPQLSSPQDGAELTSLVVTFEWAIGLGADNHRLLVDEESDFSSPVLDVTLGAADNTYTPPTELAPDTYWWKVVAVDAAGNENSSPVRLFTVTPPGV
ncbi:MAG: hypothetical protein QMD95_04160, partial [Candidatus Hodarchaeaceae archaeon]|nr:hypothetical protein [Candidatus Hodarchaeaceae archaeon]